MLRTICGHIWSSVLVSQIIESLKTTIANPWTRTNLCECLDRLRSTGSEKSGLKIKLTFTTTILANIRSSGKVKWLSQKEPTKKKFLTGRICSGGWRLNLKCRWYRSGPSECILWGLLRKCRHNQSLLVESFWKANLCCRQFSRKLAWLETVPCVRSYSPESFWQANDAQICSSRS